MPPTHIQITAVNDTREFHRQHDEQLTGETTLAMVLTANNDLCEASPGIMIAWHLYDRWLGDMLAAGREITAPRTLVIGIGEGYETFDMIIEIGELWQKAARALPSVSSRPSFTLLDYSEKLLHSRVADAFCRHIRDELGFEVEQVLGDANRLADTLGQEPRFDMIAANEMIGDLLTVRYRISKPRAEADAAGLAKDVARILGRIGKLKTGGTAISYAERRNRCCKRLEVGEPTERRLRRIVR